MLEDLEVIKRNVIETSSAFYNDKKEKKISTFLQCNGKGNHALAIMAD